MAVLLVTVMLVAVAVVAVDLARRVTAPVRDEEVSGGVDVDVS